MVPTPPSTASPYQLLVSHDSSGLKRIRRLSPTVTQSNGRSDTLVTTGKRTSIIHTWTEMVSGRIATAQRLRSWEGSLRSAARAAIRTMQTAPRIGSASTRPLRCASVSGSETKQSRGSTDRKSKESGERKAK